MKKVISKLGIVCLICTSFSLPAAARDGGTDVLLGINFGTALTSNPSSLQQMTRHSHYVDYFGQLMLLTHTQIDDNWSYEFQFPIPLLGVYSTVHALAHSEEETKMKFSFPFDFRMFGGNDIISAYIGVGLQYSTVWNFISSEGDSHTHTYYDPWWGVYYKETYSNSDDLEWKWTANQLSTNLAFGLKFGLFSAEAEDPQTGSYVDYRPFNIILGTKFHFPIINNGEKHGDGDNYVDLSRDKTFVSLTGALAYNWPGGAFKIDYEYPLGGTNNYALYDGGHGTFFNTQSQSFSATLLFKLK